MKETATNENLEQTVRHRMRVIKQGAAEVIGEEEMKQGRLTLKNMTDGTQSLLTPDEAIAFLTNL